MSRAQLTLFTHPRGERERRIAWEVIHIGEAVTVTDLDSTSARSTGVHRDDRMDRSGSAWPFGGFATARRTTRALPSVPTPSEGHWRGEIRRDARTEEFLTGQRPPRARCAGPAHALQQVLTDITERSVTSRSPLPGHQDTLTGLLTAPRGPATGAVVRAPRRARSRAVPRPRLFRASSTIDGPRCRDRMSRRLAAACADNVRDGDTVARSAATSSPSAQDPSMWPRPSASPR